jgi:hypothetical protein
MASAALSRRVRRVVAYPPLCDMSDLQRREFHEALLGADTFGGLRARGSGDPQGRAEPTAGCELSRAASSGGASRGAAGHRSRRAKHDGLGVGERQLGRRVDEPHSDGINGRSASADRRRAFAVA